MLVGRRHVFAPPFFHFTFIFSRLTRHIKVGESKVVLEEENRRSKAEVPFDYVPSSNRSRQQWFSMRAREETKKWLFAASALCRESLDWCRACRLRVIRGTTFLVALVCLPNDQTETLHGRAHFQRSMIKIQWSNGRLQISPHIKRTLAPSQCSCRVAPIARVIRTMTRVATYGAEPKQLIFIFSIYR